MAPILRFAPSPTGPLHLGGLRTALFNYLYARKFAGKWILRIEDTDTARLSPGSLDNIRECLEWAGLHYDYGPGCGGPHAPYVQSERLDLYHRYSKKLVESGDAYHCFCSSDELAAKRQYLQQMGSTSTYDRACRKLTEGEVFRRLRAKERSVVRIDDTRAKLLPPFEDIIFGEVRDASASLPTDPILLKSDQFPTYHLACVVDDHEMGITHVLRGEEWLPSLPLHRDLYHRLEWTPPIYGHLPLLLNPDGSKISKRKGDVGVKHYMENYWEVDAVLNWLVETGKTQQQEPTQESVYKNLERLAREFDLTKYTRRRTVLDPAKLKNLNRLHLSIGLSDDTQRASVISKAQKVLKETYISRTFSDDYVGKVLDALGDRLGRLGELSDVGNYFFDFKGLAEVPCPNPPSIHVLIVDHLLAHFFEAGGSLNLPPPPEGVSSKQYLSSVRHALTGKRIGPSLPAIIQVLGRDETVDRLKQARSLSVG